MDYSAMGRLAEQEEIKRVLQGHITAAFNRSTTWKEKTRHLDIAEELAEDQGYELNHYIPQNIINIATDWLWDDKGKFYLVHFRATRKVAAKAFVSSKVRGTVKLVNPETGKKLATVHMLNEAEAFINSKLAIAA